MREPYKMPKAAWVLLIIMFVLTLLSMTGIVTGILIEVVRLCVSVAAIIVIGVSWFQHSRQPK